MKTKINEILKTILLVVGTGALLYLLLEAVDYFSDGVLLQAIADKLSYETSYTDKNGVVYVTQRIMWSDVKRTVITFLVLLTLVVIGVHRTIIRRQVNRLRGEIEKKEWELDVESQRKNDLITYLAHDLKTPLTSVIGYLSLLDEAPDMPETQRLKYTKVGLDKALRLELLINEFFDITRYNLQEIELSKEDLNLSLLFTQMADEFYPVMKEKGVAINLDIPDEVNILADPDKLARVFNNILKNAISYCAKDTEIKVKITDQEENVEVVISNHGKTIPKEKLDRIFDKFYRLDEARSTNTGGAGLGLAIAKKIVTLHGGTIAVESVDGKTTFTVTLPR